MSYQTIQTTVENKCLYITLCRPERLNSFDIKLGTELHQALSKVSKDDRINLVILTGIGKGFCGGGDVKEMYEAENKPQFLRDLTKIIHKCVLEIRNMEKPVIAVVNGAAFGAGFSLAIACDLIIATPKARFGTAFIGIGLAPGCGTQLLTNIIGYQKACEYILTSKVFDAKEAENLGIVNIVVSEEQIDSEIKTYVDRFEKLPSIAVGKAKMLINKSLDNNLTNHLELESITAAFTAGTEDFCEGVTAFVEKRKPNFKGK
jgi:2-(1,2-epoxy-1,2-dihydrophenyl)acetyl-CoA isomerase